MATKKETSVTPSQPSGFMTLANSDFGAMLASELDGLDLTFERIKIPSGGSTVFEVPGEGDEADTLKELSAVILHHHPLLAYYKTKYTGGNNPPDCGSFDGVTGEGDPGGECKNCPYNRFGTGENGSKACKNRRRIYLLREGEVFPMLLSLPTGSLKEFTKYIKRLLSKGRKSNSVITRFSLRKATNQGGVLYSQAQFALDRTLTNGEQPLIDALSEQVKEFSRKVSFDNEIGSTGHIEYDSETGEVIEPLGR